MTNRFKLTVSGAAVALALAAIAGTAQAQAQITPPPGYVGATGDPVVTSPYGLCWKTSDWTPEKSVIPCDAVRVVQAPPPPVAVAPPAPPPAPTPLVVAPPPPAPIIEKVALDADVLFEFDKATLRPQGEDELRKLAERLRDARVESIQAVGYADPIGNEKYNEALSAARADAVRDFLVKQANMDPQRFRTIGRGETQEFTGGQCKGLSGQKLISCLQPNRRVDVEVRGERQVAGSQGPAGAGATTGSGTSGGTSGSKN